MVCTRKCAHRERRLQISSRPGKSRTGIHAGSPSTRSSFERCPSLNSGSFLTARRWDWRNSFPSFPYFPSPLPLLFSRRLLGFAPAIASRAGLPSASACKPPSLRHQRQLQRNAPDILEHRLVQLHWMMKGFRPKPSAVWLKKALLASGTFLPFPLDLTFFLVPTQFASCFANFQLSRLIHNPASHTDTFPLCEPWREAPQEILSSIQGGNGFYVSRNKRL